MAAKLNPYLSFDGNARQAMEYYRDVFGGELALSTFGQFGGNMPDPDKIMHASLTTDSGLTLMGSDMPPGTDYQPGNNSAISLSGDDEAELTGYWTKLSDGGVVTVALEKQMWGDVFGMCKDRFGVDWMVNIAQPSAE